MARVIQQGRQLKGLSQKDLATKINEKPQIVNDYEAGRWVNFVITHNPLFITFDLLGESQITSFSARWNASSAWNFVARISARRWRLLLRKSNSIGWGRRRSAKIWTWWTAVQHTKFIVNVLSKSFSLYFLRNSSRVPQPTPQDFCPIHTLNSSWCNESPRLVMQWASLMIFWAFHINFSQCFHGI